jgi:NhaA family Na+:H+ antiporter
MIAIWVCVFLSGIHATIAGVLIAFTIPVKSTIEPQRFFDVICKHMALLKESEITRDSMVDNKEQRQAIEQIYLTAEEMIPAGIYLEDKLHSIQAFLILPLFALFAAGVTIDQSTLAAFPSNVSFGIIGGLVLGKPLGIGLFSYFTIKGGWAELPEHVTWGPLMGTACLGGIGFTMSIFISELAFTENAVIYDAKIAIFIASILAAVLGYVILTKTLPSKTMG